MARKKSATTDIATVSVGQTTIYQLPLSMVEVDPKNNGRINTSENDIKQLAASIAKLGMLQPVGVRSGGTNGNFILEWGFRRYAAMKLLAAKEDGPQTIAAVLSTTGEDSFQRNIAENAQRIPTSPLEDAKNLVRLTKSLDEGGEGLTQKEAGQLYGRPQPWVSHMLTLLELPEDMQEAVHKGELGVKAATTLSRADEIAYQDWRDGKIKDQFDAAEAVRQARIRAEKIEKARAATSETPDTAVQTTQDESVDGETAQGSSPDLETPVEAPKRGRGRPPKNSTELGRGLRDVKQLITAMGDKPPKSPVHQLAALYTSFLDGKLDVSQMVKRITALFRKTQQQGMEPEESETTSQVETTVQAPGDES